MADETQAAPAAAEAGEQTQAKAAKEPSKVLLPAAVGTAILLGSALGVFVVGPRLVAARAPAVDSTVADTTEAAGHEEASLGGPLFRIDNLIVNPAGSQGSRFLMISVAIETENGEVAEHLRSQEPKVRDAIIALLERTTMEILAQPGIRDSLKREMADTIARVAGADAKLRVYLPQFVIQ